MASAMDAHVSIPFVNAIVSFCHDFGSDAPPPLALQALSPNFRISIEMKAGERDKQSGVSLKRFRDEDRDSLFFRFMVKQLSLAQGTSSTRRLELLCWWLIRNQSSPMRVISAAYSKKLARLLPYVSALSLHRRHAQTLQWIPENSTNLQELTLEHCSSVADWECLSALSHLRSLTLRECRVERSAWMGTLNNLERLSVIQCTQLPADFSVPFAQLPHLQLLEMKGFRQRMSLQRAAQSPRLRKVVLEGPLNGDTPVSGAEALGELAELRELSCRYCGIENVSWLTKCTALEGLALTWCRSVKTAPPPAETLANLRQVDISCTSLPDASFLRDSTLISELRMNGCREVQSLEWLGRLTNMVTLNISAVEVRDLTPLTQMASTLETLHAAYCTTVVSFAPLGALTALRHLDVDSSNVTDLSWIAGCGKLESLTVSNCPQIDSLDMLGLLQHLADVNCEKTGIRSLSWLNGCSKLTRANIQSCQQLAADATVDTPPPHLRELSLKWSNVSNISWVTKCPELTTLLVDHCERIASFDWLREMPQLQRLGIDVSTFADVSLLQSCTDLRKLSLSYELNRDVLNLFPTLEICYSLYL